MANGFAKIKDINGGNIVRCADHEKEIKRNAGDINEIGKKMGKVYWIAVTVLIGLIANLITMLVKKP
jgi:tetrahydromethanopterin S-methyltransferase subunit G